MCVSLCGAGGQHQGSNSPVYWPVDFVTAMVVDGKVINLVNFWKHDDINAGDDLLMYVEDRPYVEYVLSHHPKCMKKQVFPMLDTWELPAFMADMTKEGYTTTEGEVLLTRIFDLLSGLTTVKHLALGMAPPAAGNPGAAAAGGGNNMQSLLVANNTRRAPFPPIADFDRSEVNAEQLKSKWQAQESLNSISSAGAYSRYDKNTNDEDRFGRNGAMTYQHQLKNPYLTPNNIINLLPQEAYYEVKVLLMDTLTPNNIQRFLQAVQRRTFQYKQAVFEAVQRILGEMELNEVHKEANVRKRKQMIDAHDQYGEVSAIIYHFICFDHV